MCTKFQDQRSKKVFGLISVGFLVAVVRQALAHAVPVGQVLAERGPGLRVLQPLVCQRDVLAPRAGCSLASPGSPPFGGVLRPGGAGQRRRQLHL